MGRVDPDDDSIQRYVALHFRYDPVRRERRHVAVAAFDNEPEYHDFLDGANADLTARQEAGQAEPREHVSGRVYEPGHRRRQQNARVRRHAMQRGVWPTRLDIADLPISVGILRAGAST